MKIPERDFFKDLYGDFFTGENKTADKLLKRGSDDARKAARDLDAIEKEIEALTKHVNTSYTELLGSTPSQDAKNEKKPEGPQTSTETAQTEPAPAPAEPETDPMEDLDGLMGLAGIKQDVKELIAFVKLQKLREEKGLKSVPVSLHLVFSGNPGTGKTTVARILARLYKNIGVLSKGQLVEVDRSALVAGYVGQTAIKTQEKIKEAMGGVLFIDEAYTLSNGNPGDFGQEAIDTILKAMEDNRKDFVVIVAGYPDLMKKFVGSNPGLKSRFNKYFLFEDYTADELIGIFESNLKKYDYKMDDEMRAIVSERIRHMEENKDENFANAREIRNFFETIVTNQAGRVGEIAEPTDDDLIYIRPEDLPEEKLPEPKPKTPSEELADMLKQLNESANASLETDQD